MADEEEEGGGQEGEEEEEEAENEEEEVGGVGTGEGGDLQALWKEDFLKRRRKAAIKQWKKDRRKSEKLQMRLRLREKGETIVTRGQQRQNE